MQVEGLSRGNSDAVSLGAGERVSLHEHLDGSLLTGTLIELAAGCGVNLPESDEAGLTTWLRQQVRGSLGQYLSCFALTTAVMQTEENLERVAYEHMAQLHEDRVAYAELRFAPQLHAPGWVDSIEAVGSGVRRGMAEFGIEAGIIVCAMRDQDPAHSLAAAHAAVAHPMVVGFDLAGEEWGHPPTEHREALAVIREAGIALTIHAGEGDGVASISAAIEAGATRLGHGVRIIEDITQTDRGVHLGSTAGRIREEGIHLEVCISSNVDTGLYPVEQHPVLQLHRAGLNVGLSTDNRMMSATNLEREEQIARRILGGSEDEIRAMRANAARARFTGRN